MEKQFKIGINGAAVQSQDIDTLARPGAIADDHVIAELFRLNPYDATVSNASQNAVAKGILPTDCTMDPSGSITPGTYRGTVQSSGSSNHSVVIRPFRAVIGSRQSDTSDARLNWHDVRSNIWVAAANTSLNSTFQFANGDATNPRWDLLYVSVTPDTNSPSPTTRKVKDPTSKVIAATATVTTLESSLAIGVVQGTPAATPSKPNVPVDGAGVYYVPLAWVRIPAGSNTVTTVADTDIIPCANFLSMSPRATGAMIVGPADGANYGWLRGNVVRGESAWSASGTKPDWFLSPEMTGGRKIFVALDLSNASSANWSHNNGQLIDGRDWRNCLFEVKAWANTGDFAWHNGATVGTTIIPNVQSGVLGTDLYNRPGQSFIDETSVIDADNGSATGLSNVALVARMTHGLLSVQASATFVYVYCDLATGNLIFYSIGAPLTRYFMTIEAVGPMPNFGL